MAKRKDCSDFTLYGKFEVKYPHTDGVIFSTDSSKIFSLEQVTINNTGSTSTLRSKESIDDLRELINKVFDEREKIKEMEEEVRKKNVAIFCAQYSNNPNKYKK